VVGPRSKFHNLGHAPRSHLRRRGKWGGAAFVKADARSDAGDVTLGQKIVRDLYLSRLPSRAGQRRRT